MNYSTATIDAHAGGGPVSTFDLEGKTLADLYAELREAFGNVDADEDGDTDPDEGPSNVTFTNPQGFAVHLFSKTHPSEPGGGEDCTVSGNFDDILEAWSNESDEDRREAMGEYLDDMGAGDLNDFDEAYQGQYSDGAAFAEQICEDLGTVSKDFPSWIAIDWEQTWNGGLRFDYTITDSGHVFRNM